MAKKRRRIKAKRGSTIAVAKREQSKSGKAYLVLPDGISLYSPESGKTEKIDILPYVVQTDTHPDKQEVNDVAIPGSEWYRLPFKIHANVGGGNEVVVCPTTFEKKCPVCEYFKHKQDVGVEWEKIKQFKAKRRCLYVVIPVEGKNKEKIMVMDQSTFTFEDKLQEELKEQPQFDFFYDLEEGSTLSVRWKEESMGKNSFDTASRIDFEERDEFDESILDEIPNLEECLIILSYKEIEKKLNGNDEDDEEEQEDVIEESTTRKIKPRVKEPDEEQEDEEPPFDEEQSEEVQPDLTWSDLKDMDITELCDVIEEYELTADPDDFENVEELAEAVANEMGIEIIKEKSKKSTSRKTSTKKTSSKSSEPNCPHGYNFGIDTDDHDECDECELWEKCFDKKEGN